MYTHKEYLKNSQFFQDFIKCLLQLILPTLQIDAYN